jgi:hypothetical protein
MIVRNGEAVGSILHDSLTKTGKPRAGVGADPDLLVSGSDEDQPVQPASNKAPASTGGAASIRSTDVKGK